MMSRIELWSLMIILAAVFIIPGCFSEGGEALPERSAPEADIDVFGIQYDNPHPLVKWPSTLSCPVNSLLYSPLFALDAEGELVPALAKDITWEEGQAVITLRSDLNWHDGEELTVDDIVFSFELLLHPEFKLSEPNDELDFIDGVKQYRQGEAESISGLSALDDVTLEVELDDKSANIWHLKFFRPVPKHIFADSSVDDVQSTMMQEEPVGSGAYQWTSSEESEDALVVELSLFEEFYAIEDEDKEVEESEEESDRYEVVRVNFREDSPSEGTSSDLLYVHGPSTIDIDRDDYDPEFLLGEGFEYLGFDHSNSFLSHSDVRRAIAMAIDREGLAETVFGFAGEVVDSPLPWSEIDKLDHDPEKAAELLASSDYFHREDDEELEDEGLDPGNLPQLNLVYPAEDSHREIIAKQIADDLEGIGLEIQVFPVSRELLLHNLYGRQRFDLYLLGMPWRKASDMRTWTVENPWGYELDDKRQEEYGWAESVSKDQPIAFLFSPRNLLFVHEEVSSDAPWSVPPVGNFFNWYLISGQGN